MTAAEILARLRADVKLRRRLERMVERAMVGEGIIIYQHGERLCWSRYNRRRERFVERKEGRLLGVFAAREGMTTDDMLELLALELDHAGLL